MILLDAEYAEVSVNEELNLAKIVWKEECSSEEYRKAFQILLEYHKEAKIPRYLSDIRDQGIITREDTNWFYNQAFPEAVKYGLKAAAVVFSGNVFQKIYINLILTATKRFGLPTRVFNDNEVAIEWLMRHD